jgi:hypothetical protein
LKPDDITKLMESADPVNTSDVQGWPESPEAQEILAGIVTSSYPTPRQRSRGPLLVPLAVLLVLAAAGATYVLTSYHPTSEPRSVGCYRELDQSADTVVVGIRPADVVLGPAGVCARGWAMAFGEPAPGALVTCIVEGGGTGVFPNRAELSPDEACSSIGAALPEDATYGGLPAQEVPVLSGEVGSRVAPLYVEEDCAPAGQLIAALNAFLSERGLAGWRVEDQTSTSQRWTFDDGTTRTVAVPTTAEGERCAVHVVDPVEARILVINGWPRLPEG